MGDDTTESNTAVVTPPVSTEAAPIATTPPAVPESFVMPAPAAPANEGLVSAPDLANTGPLDQAPTLPTNEAPVFPQATGPETPTPFGQVSEPNATATSFSQPAETATAQPVESSWSPSSPDSQSTNTMGDQVGTGLGTPQERVIEAPTVPGGLPPPQEQPTQPLVPVKVRSWKNLWGLL